MRHWVFLADPETYGWAELVQEKRAVWDGIRNAVAQRNLRACEVGDEVLIYHTSPDKAIMGVARVASGSRPDPSDPDRVVVDVEPVRALQRPLALAELKADDGLQQLGFVRMPRVAVQPVSPEHFRRVLQLSGTR